LLDLGGGDHLGQRALLTNARAVQAAKTRRLRKGVLGRVHADNAKSMIGN
jgi:hypothetical protein